MRKGILHTVLSLLIDLLLSACGLVLSSGISQSFQPQGFQVVSLVRQVCRQQILSFVLWECSFPKHSVLTGVFPLLFCVIPMSSGRHCFCWKPAFNYIVVPLHGGSLCLLLSRCLVSWLSAAWWRCIEVWVSLCFHTLAHWASWIWQVNVQHQAWKVVGIIC